MDMEIKTRHFQLDDDAREVIEGIKAGLQNRNLRNSLQNFSPVKIINRLCESD